MKKLALALLLSTALIAPAAAQAANVAVKVDIKPYSGPSAYLAVYVVDANGTYDSTLWVAGQNYRYLGALRGWAGGFSRSGATSIDGISGASVGSGRSLTVTATLSDALIDAGYSIVVDTAVENGGEYTADAKVPLNSAGGTAAGHGYVGRLTVSM